MAVFSIIVCGNKRNLTQSFLWHGQPKLLITMNRLQISFQLHNSSLAESHSFTTAIQFGNSSVRCLSYIKAIRLPKLITAFIINLFTYSLFNIIREGEWVCAHEWGRSRERERIPSRLHTQCRAGRGTPAHDLGIVTWAEIQILMLNPLSHPGARLINLNQNWLS